MVYVDTERGKARARESERERKRARERYGRHECTLPYRPEHLLIPECRYKYIQNMLWG